MSSLASSLHAEKIYMKPEDIILELVLIVKCGIIEIMKAEYKRTNYPSDLSDREWEKIKEFFPAGNKSKYDKRNLVEAVIIV